MNDIITYWGAYTSLAAVVSSPYYTRVEIPVNPRHFEQWRDDVFSSPSLNQAMLPEAIAKATFTLHAVLPPPTRYLAQMSSLQLDYLARSLYDDQYEERKNILGGDDHSEDHMERLKRTYTTLTRIRLVYQARLNESAGDRLSLEDLWEAIEDILLAFDEDLDRTERGEVAESGRNMLTPRSSRSSSAARSRSRSHPPQFIYEQPDSGDIYAPLGPRTRGRGFRTLFHREPASPTAEDIDSTRAQASTNSQSVSATPELITMTIPSGDMSALHHVIESGQLTEAALHAIRNIVESNSSPFEPGTRLVEDGELTGAAARVMQTVHGDESSRPTSLKSKTHPVDETHPLCDDGDRES